MRYVAAYMLASLGSKRQVTANDIQDILLCVGIECVREKAEEVIKKMQGKTVDELIVEGSNHLSSVSTTPSTVAAGAVATSVGQKDGPAAPAPALVEKKEEKKEEESDEDMGFGLFD
ncbi:unnamed protein product [Thelazia callipaeda]|uniref:Large ribosomal subunit protein P2 n=1 Tax=Thelazia callipaeda TaxID=103827 RepID=A0A0N5CW45_THECL|nr:unnamed protein product [Thelazia callipaeda]